MKKILALLLAIVMVIGLCACGSGAAKSNDATAASSTNTSSDTNSESAKNDATGNTEPTGTDFSEKVELTWAAAGSATSGAGQVAGKVQELVTERSGGAITFNYIPDGALGNDADLTNQLIEGTIDMVSTSIGTVSAYYELISAIQIPFLVNSYELEQEVTKSAEWDALVQAANEGMGGARIMATLENGMRQFALVDKAATTVDDLSGVKLRTGGSEVVNKAMSLVGANPVTVSMADTFSAMQNGVVDGEEINYIMMAMLSHYEAVKYVSEVNMYPWVCFELMSEAAIEKLPEGYFELIQECYNEAAEWWWTEGIVASDAAAKDVCQSSGMEIVEFEESDKLAELCEPLYEEYSAKDARVAAFIEYVQGVK